MRIFSFGGGVQSVAVLVLQATQRLAAYDTFVFANVGHDSENPKTLAYYVEYVIPFCEEFGVNLVEVQKKRKGEYETLLQAIERDNASVPIPVYLSGGSPGHRVCTTDFKIRVVDKWIRSQKVTRAIVGLGISTDESKRRRGEEWTDVDGSKPLGFSKRREYPLLDLGISRSACEKLILDVGLPIPPKSSCWFCPFHHPGAWIDMKRNDPEQFAAAIQLEHSINEKRLRAGKDKVYLHSRVQPLEQATGDQMSLFETACTTECDSGYCHT